MQIVKRFITWFSDTFKKKGLVGKVILIAVALSMGCCLCSVPIAIFSPETPAEEVSGISIDKAEATPEVVIEIPTNTPLPSATPEPLKYLENLVADALGSSNRDVPRISSFIWDTDSSEIVVTFAGQDNFTDDMIKRSIQMDIVNVLEAIHKSGTPLPYNFVAVVGTFALVDEYGNAKEANVVIATYSRDTLDKINWDNFLTDNIYTVADQDTLFLHPVLR